MVSKKQNRLFICKCPNTHKEMRKKNLFKSGKITVAEKNPGKIYGNQGIEMPKKRKASPKESFAPLR